MEKRTIKVSPSEIIEKLEKEFSSAYKPFGKFQSERLPLWKKSIEAVNDINLMEKILFCNDLLNIPPVRVFLAVHPEITDIDSYEKKFIGAFWAFIFKEKFGYEIQKKVSLRHPIIKAGMYFEDDLDDTIQIVPDEEKKVNTSVDKKVVQNKKEKTLTEEKSESKKDSEEKSK